MWLTKSIEVTLGDKDTEMLLGIYNQAFDGFPVDEDGEPILDNEPIRINRCLIGFLIFNIGIYYK